jgi:RNA recognition motif-containing protein
MNIFVGSLPYVLSEADLRELFENFGEVSSVKIITDKISGRSKGFGFIEMPDEEAAKKAMEDLNGKEVQGRAIVVNKAEERKDTNRGGGNFRSDNRGGGFRKDFNKGNRKDY